jgi:hypothetical protein
MKVPSSKRAYKNSGFNSRHHASRFQNLVMRRIVHEAPRQTDRGVHKIWRWVEPVVVVVAPQKVKKNWVKFQQTQH